MSRSKSAPVDRTNRFELDAERLRAMDRRSKLPAFTPLDDYARRGAKIIVRAKGVFVWDVDGRQYLDGSAAIWNVNLGFGNREIAEAVREQLETLSFHLSLLDYSTPAAIEMAERLAALAPPGLNRVLFTSGGSEANESVIRLTRLYFKLRGYKDKTVGIARRLGYHGSSTGAATLTGIEHFHEHFEPLLPGVRHIEPPYCYRCPLDLSYPSCSVACADELEKAILAECPDRVAFFIAEPVMGAGGVIPAPREYWSKVRAICDRYDVLLVADEVITGAGRTGKFFAVEHWDAAPDIISCAKGISSGYLPLGAVILHDKIYQTLIAAPAGQAVWHGYTNTGNPACCAAGLKTLDIMERDGVLEHAEKMGRRLLEGLERLAGSPIVGDLRGLGLMAAVELVRDKGTRAQFSPPGEAGRVFRDAAREAGLLLRAIGDSVCLSPPLIISEGELRMLLERFETALRRTESWARENNPAN